MTTDAPPKVFISYSWSSDEHTQWVGELATRLRGDGVDVVFDKWDLKHGQDINKFMEQMVNDPEICRVLIVSDPIYVEKADQRVRGVGKETLIISQQVYKQVNQTKFVPIVWEHDSQGLPPLPTYLESRRCIDFTDDPSSAYDELLRNIYDRLPGKPPLGKPPSHIVNDEPALLCRQQARRFKRVLESSRGNLRMSFHDFVEAWFQDFECLRMTYQGQPDWVDMLRENIRTGLQHRDLAIDVLFGRIRYNNDEWLFDDIKDFLQRLIAYTRHPILSGSFYVCSEDNYRFLIYELTQYLVAAAIQARRYSDLRALFDYQFLPPQYVNDPDGDTLFRSFDDLCVQAKSLDRSDRQRLSVTADIVKERATRSDLRFREVVQADVICGLTCPRWYPVTLVYARSVGRLELFARASTQSAPLEQLLCVDSKEALNEKILRIVEGWERIFRINGIRSLLGVDDLG